MPKIIFLSGSIRKDSFNSKLAKLACAIATQKGVETQLLDLGDYEMPIYNGDFESENGLPENAKKLKAQFANADGFLIASPEYNSSFSALLKNSLDWISRPHEKNETPLVAFNGKVAAIVAASPGALGGLRGLVPLRLLLSNIGVLVVPQQLAVSKASEAFDEKGQLTNERFQSTLENIIDQLIKYASK